MTRKIVFNIFAAFIYFPSFFIGKSLWDYYGVNGGNPYDNYPHSFWEYFSILLHDYSYPSISFVFLILILLPFQLFKDHYFRKHNKGLSLSIKCLMLTGTVVFLWIILFRFPLIDWYKLFIFSTLGIGCGTALILYWGIDRYVERTQAKEK
ncbi:hypothetical protein [Sphingobacterium faecale]|uniref:Uncharacterized protein n=1 Tax=Sphingobacterium faecale TaxID=2803775 RepID=A0ABS1RAL1_9SPHI|nr:hypothetical protein [Sphingobacterium faecale]MBL1411067.1 hypothetical protein [Sphingobacterium faecale]